MSYFVDDISSSDIGFVGEWQIDYTTWRVRGNGQVGPFFGVPFDKMSQSVNLDLLDRAYLPADLELIRQNRVDLIGIGGSRCLRYKLLSPETREPIDAYSFLRADVDRYGELRQARGVLFAASTFKVADDQNDTYPRHEDALRHLMEAAKAVRELGFSHLQSILQVVFKQVAQDALQKHLPRH